MPLPVFITIPRPINGQKGRVNAQRRGSNDWKTQVYLVDLSEREYLQRAANLCGCSLSQYLRQCALNTAYALGVLRDVPDSDQRSLQTESEDSEAGCAELQFKGD